MYKCPKVCTVITKYIFGGEIRPLSAVVILQEEGLLLRWLFAFESSANLAFTQTLLWVELNFSFWTTRKFGLSTTFHLLTFLYWFTVHCLFQCCFCTNITLPHSFLPFWIIGKVWFPRRGLSKASNQCNAPNPEVSLRQLHHQHKQLCRLINITLNIINRPPRPIFFRCNIDSISQQWVIGSVMVSDFGAIASTELDSLLYFIYWEGQTDWTLARLKRVMARSSVPELVRVNLSYGLFGNILTKQKSLETTIITESPWRSLPRTNHCQRPYHDQNDHHDHRHLEVMA